MADRTLELRSRMARPDVIRFVGLFGLAFVVFALVLLFFGKNPIRAYVDIFSSTLGSAYGFSEVLVKMIPLILTRGGGGSAARIWLINVGGEGQLYIGALFATWGALTFGNLACLASPAPDYCSGISGRRAVGVDFRRSARPGLGQRDDLHASAELCGHPAVEFLRLRPLERPGKRQLSPERSVSGGGHPARILGDAGFISGLLYALLR